MSRSRIACLLVLSAAFICLLGLDALAGMNSALLVNESSDVVQSQGVSSTTMSPISKGAPDAGPYETSVILAPSTAEESAGTVVTGTSQEDNMAATTSSTHPESTSTSSTAVDESSVTSGEGVIPSTTTSTLPESASASESSGVIDGVGLFVEKKSYEIGEPVNVHVLSGGYSYDLWIRESSGWFLALQNGSGDVVYSYSANSSGNYSAMAEFSYEGVSR
jgi:hypothetical protein